MVTPDDFKSGSKLILRLMFSFAGDGRWSVELRQPDGMKRDLPTIHDPKEQFSYEEFDEYRYGYATAHVSWEKLRTAYRASMERRPDRFSEEEEAVILALPEWTVMYQQYLVDELTEEKKARLISEQIAQLRQQDQSPTAAGWRRGDILETSIGRLLVTNIEDAARNYIEYDFVDQWIQPSRILGTTQWGHPCGSSWHGDEPENYAGEGFLALPYFQRMLQEKPELKQVVQESPALQQILRDPDSLYK